jgi:DNA-directed RNA polymerase subunit RPC12/RpoP
LGALIHPAHYGEMYDDESGEFECKYCGTQTAFRSHRKHFFEFLRTRLTGKVPFRCNRCERRFWALIDPRDI